MNSEEAAALFMSDGITKDIHLAAKIDAARAYDLHTPTELEMDAFARKSIRDSLGFDFSITLDEQLPYVRVSSTEKPIVATRAKMFEGDVSPGNKLTNQEALDRVLNAIERLKVKWDKMKELEIDVIEVEEC